MSKQSEELYLAELFGSLTFDEDLVQQFEEADAHSFQARLRRVRENLGISDTGITQVRIPTDAGYTDVLVAPTLLPNFDPANYVERWIFATPDHDVTDFTVDTTEVTDMFVFPTAPPLERIAGFVKSRPRIHRPEELGGFRTDDPPHIEIGRLATDKVELFLGDGYEMATKIQAVQSFGSVHDEAFLSRIEAIPTSCAEVLTGQIQINHV